MWNPDDPDDSDNLREEKEIERHWNNSGVRVLIILFVY